MTMVLAGVLAINVYVPALPEISRALHASPTEVQLTLTVFLIAFGVAQLVLGPMSDRYGRRPAGIWFFSLGALALVGAGQATGPYQIAALVFVFYIAATGVNVSLTAQAGLLGPKAVAAFVTASDLGSAVGPNLGWLAPQIGLPAAAIFAVGCGLYAVGGVAAVRALGPAAPGAGTASTAQPK